MATDICPLSLHDALPICFFVVVLDDQPVLADFRMAARDGGDLRRLDEHAFYFGGLVGDRKSTRLNSSHMSISYAVFCLKKKKRKDQGWDTIFYRSNPCQS